LVYERCGSYPDNLGPDRSCHHGRGSLYGGKARETLGWAIAATFALFVIFDLSRMGIIPFLAGIDAFLFLGANIAMLIAVWLMIREK
jgi:hypothetical protein